MALLELHHVAVSLKVDAGQRPVILDADLSVATAEAVGLVGESGAGKSITSRAIIRLLPPGSSVTGDIRFDGQSVLALKGRSLRRYRGNEVAMVFQDPRAHINPVRKIGDFLREGLVTNQGMSADDASRRVLFLLESVGIRDGSRRLKQYPHELSGGQLQRVMIAAALATEPKLLLADEPTTALDVTTQAEVMGILDGQRRRRNLAMLFVTHNLELAAAVCDRIVVMYAGVVVEDIVAGRLHTCAQHPYTAALLASRPSTTARTARLQAIPGRAISAHEAGSGCHFASRCTFAQAQCLAERPKLRRLGHGLVACHRAEEVADQLITAS